MHLGETDGEDRKGRDVSSCMSSDDVKKEKMMQWTQASKII